MRAAYKDRQWVLIGDNEVEIARFKTRAQLMKYWNENPDAKAQEVNKAEEPSSQEDWDEEEDLEEEEDS